MDIDEDTPEHTLTSVYPKPMTNAISFEFTLNCTQNVSVQLFDGFGNAENTQGIHQAGLGTINIQTTQTLQPGIIHYQVILGNEINSGSILKL